MQHTNPVLNKIFLIVFTLSLIVTFPVLLQAKIPDKGYKKTVEAFSRVACEDEQLFEYKKDLIRSLTYTNKRALRAFAKLDSITAAEFVATLERLVFEKISFDNVQLLERFVTLAGASDEMSWQFLDQLEKLDYSKGRVMTGFTLVDVITARELLSYVSRIEAMPEPAAWALKAFLLLPGHSGPDIGATIAILSKMNKQQQWTAEQSCRIKNINAFHALEIIQLLATLSRTDAWNAKGLFKQDISAGEAKSWVKYYFSETQEQKEWLFFARNPAEKAVFLRGLAEASDYLTWKINDLHSVTNGLGREISAASLRGGSKSYLTTLFRRLDWKTREKFKNAFYGALNSGKKGKAISTLRKATSKARAQAAHDITTVHIYILLSKGSDLYDSSFRDILVPILTDRIEKRFQGNLLRFLLAVDPENNHVSDFIISLAQRGKLAVFFPADQEEQKRVLDLVTKSAFQDENSLILFSATFMKLLETIEPTTRTYLIGEMLSAIREQNTVFTIQLRVILQYYLQYYSEFVGDVDKIRIQMMMYEYGAVPLQLYTKTAFAEWKADGRLSSLSVFHHDDDGRQSYSSNCRYLSKKGYHPRVSAFYNLGVPAGVIAHAKQIVRSYKANPSSALKKLFLLQVKYPFAVDWVKQLKGIEISHSVFIFQGEGVQRELLKQYLLGKHEMFAQRGHSYWRSEQLIDPISKLIEDGDVTDHDLAGKQRFMSLGSCGGIRAYSELANLFNHNVDILATVGTGKAVVNNPYNQFLFEVVANGRTDLSWDDVAEKSSRIFKQGLGEDYLQPGSLPAILHKIMDQKTTNNGTD